MLWMARMGSWHALGRGDNAGTFRAIIQQSLVRNSKCGLLLASPQPRQGLTSGMAEGFIPGNWHDRCDRASSSSQAAGLAIGGPRDEKPGTNAPG